jgi:hypothetical protein
MTYRPYLVALGLLVILGAGIALFRIFSEPSYQGENFDYWARAIESNDEEVRAQAYPALVGLMKEHPRARSRFLLRLEMEQSDLACKSALKSLASRRSLDADELEVVLKVATRTQDPDVKKASLVALSFAKKEVAPAMSWISGCLDNPALQESTFAALEALGDSAEVASPALVAHLKSGKIPADKFMTSMELIRRIDKNYRPVTLELSTFIMDGADDKAKIRLATCLSASAWSGTSASSLVANRACDMLEQPDRSEFGIELIEALGRNNQVSERLSGKLLGLSKEQAAEAGCKRLVKAYFDSKYYASRDFVDTLVERLKNPENGDQQIAALHLLKHSGYSGRYASPAIRKVIADNPQNEELQSVAKSALLEIGSRQ